MHRNSGGNFDLSSLICQQFPSRISAGVRSAEIPLKRLSNKVILRRQPKNLEILCGVYPERLGLSLSTGLAEGLTRTMPGIREVVGQPQNYPSVLPWLKEGTVRACPATGSPLGEAGGWMI